MRILSLRPLWVLALVCCGPAPQRLDAGTPDAGPPDAGGAVGDAGNGEVKRRCADWAAGLSAAGVPEPTGTVVTQRPALIAAGGGVTQVGTKYGAAYFPPSFATSGVPRVLVDLHGTGGSPEAEWTGYRAMLDARGWGFLGLKYLDDQTQQYDLDETIYENLKTLVAQAQAHCDLDGAKFFLVGFSRGAAKTFPMAYFDRKGARLFTAFGAQSGGAWQQPAGCAWFAGAQCAWQPTSPLYPSGCAVGAGPVCNCSPLTSGAPAVPPKPPYANTILAANDVTAFAGARFWLYCGERDYSAGFRNCSDMEMSKTFVEAFGGTVDGLYEAGVSDGCSPWAGTDCLKVPDVACGHGSWKNVSAATAQMWNLFESL